MPYGDEKRAGCSVCAQASPQPCDTRRTGADIHETCFVYNVKYPREGDGIISTVVISKVEGEELNMPTNAVVRTVQLFLRQGVRRLDAHSTR